MLSLIDPERGFIQRKEFDGAAFVVAGIFLLEAGSDGFHGGPSLCNVNLRFQAADDREPAEAPVIFDFLELPGQHIVAHGDGNPKQVGATERNDSFKARGRDTHNRIGCSVQGDGLADKFVVGAEFSSPQAVA